MIGPLSGLFVATFILMKKHGFDFFKAISTKDGNNQLPKLDQLELRYIVVDEIPDRNVHDEEPSDQGVSIRQRSTIC